MTSSIPGKKNLRGVYNGYAVDQSLDQPFNWLNICGAHASPNKNVGRW
jgi:hypothetical protein